MEKIEQMTEYFLCHLPVTEENVRAAMALPDATSYQMDWLLLSLWNSPDFGMAHPLCVEVTKRMGELACKEGKNG